MVDPHSHPTPVILQFFVSLSFMLQLDIFYKNSTNHDKDKNDQNEGDGDGDGEGGQEDIDNDDHHHNNHSGQILQKTDKLHQNMCWLFRILRPLFEGEGAHPWLGRSLPQ